MLILKMANKEHNSKPQTVKKNNVLKKKETHFQTHAIHLTTWTASGCTLLHYINQ